jgi:hypothetical protein
MQISSLKWLVNKGFIIHGVRPENDEKRRFLETCKQFASSFVPTLGDKKLKTMDLCCGVGGFSLGAQLSGVADVAYGIDANPNVSGTNL